MFAQSRYVTSAFLCRAAAVLQGRSRLCDTVSIYFKNTTVLYFKANTDVTAGHSSFDPRYSNFHIGTAPFYGEANATASCRPDSRSQSWPQARRYVRLCFQALLRLLTLFISTTKRRTSRLVLVTRYIRGHAAEYLVQALCYEQRGR